jgi:iron complex transport system substrate-binding protein
MVAGVVKFLRGLRLRGSHGLSGSRGGDCPRLWTVIAPLVLVALVATIAAGVERYASPEGGLQLPLANTGDKSLVVRTGGLAYPRVAVDSDGVNVRIARPVHRIVSQAWTIDECLYAVAPARDVVAVSASAYQKLASNVLATVQLFRPAIAADPERVIALDPDLMIVSSNGRADYTSLARGSGVAVFRMQTMLQTLEEIEKALTLVGYLTGNDGAAAREATRFRSEVDAARALRTPEAAARVGTPRILGLGGHYTYGSETLFQDVVTFLRGVNVAAEHGIVGYDSVDFEQIVRWDPEWIVAGADEGEMSSVREELMRDPAISITRAAREGHILVLDNRTFLAKSPFAAQMVREMAGALYGDGRAGPGADARTQDLESKHSAETQAEGRR